jgi:hypothetical protein
MNIIKNTLAMVHRNEIVDFNLATLTYEDRRVFFMGEVDRADMPQLKGFPRGGSLAARLEQDRNGKVDVSQEFINWVCSTHKISLNSDLVSPDILTGSQNELLASKVARHVHKMSKDPENKKFTQNYIVSANYTLLDGHHGWAAARLHCMLTGGHHKLKVLVLGAGINELIDYARTFTQLVGVLPKPGV